MKFLISAAASALIAAPLMAQTSPAPAPATPAAPAAQAAVKPTLTVGTTVYDPAGATVGTIESVTADAVTLATGTTKVALPSSAFGTTEKGTAIGMTKAELETAAQSAAASSSAALKSQLVAGAQVYGQSGATVIGTVKSADASNVTLTTPKGDVQLPVAGFGSNQGKIVIGMTAAEFDAAVGAAGGAAPATAAAE